VTVVGYYTPFIYGGTILFTIGSGLLYTLKVNSPTSHWIGYQILAGFGAGGAIQLPFIATQVVLPAKDMPTGNSLAIFFNSLGGAIAISIAQNIFSNTLSQELPKAGLGDITGTILASVSCFPMVRGSLLANAVYRVHKASVRSCRKVSYRMHWEHTTKPSRQHSFCQ
jgi:hypothetical protein